MKAPRLLVAAAIGTLCCTTLARQPAPPASQPAAPPPTKLDGLLRGPTVPDSAEQTLVTTNADGRMNLLEVRPEEAALGLALVDPDRREAARRLVTARRTALGMLLVERIDLVRDATDASRGGDPDRARALYHELHALFDPGGERDPLLRDFATVLAPDELDAVRALVDGYWAAWLPRAMRNAGLDPDDPAAAAAHERRLGFEVFQREVGDAYQWSLRPFQAKLESISEITGATPEQRAALRIAIIDHVREAHLDPTPEQRRALTDRIYGILDEHQHRLLFEDALWRR